jgi:hypothetical protein
VEAKAVVERAAALTKNTQERALFLDRAAAYAGGRVNTDST